MNKPLTIHQAVVGQPVTLSTLPNASIHRIVEVEGREVRLRMKEKNDQGGIDLRWHGVHECYLPTDEQQNNDLIQK